MVMDEDMQREIKREEEANEQRRRRPSRTSEGTQPINIQPGNRDGDRPTPITIEPNVDKKPTV